MHPRLWYIRGANLAQHPDLLAELREAGRVERWGHRADVALRGDPAEVQIVLTGGAELGDGRYDTLARLGPGDLFGELGGDSHGIIRAYDDLQIATFDRDTFEAQTRGRLGDLSTNVGVVRRRLLSVPVSSLLYTLPSRRVVNVLLHLAESLGTLTDDRADLDFQPRTRALARLSGLADPAVSDIVDGLKRDRIVEVGRTKLVIPSLERMRELAIGTHQR